VEDSQQKRKAQFYASYIAGLIKEAKRTRDITQKDILTNDRKGVFALKSIEIKNIMKSFGSTRAMDSVTLTALGENRLRSVLGSLRGGEGPHAAQYHNWPYLCRQGGEILFDGIPAVGKRRGSA
jgi:hypothetical protein